MIEAVSTYI